VADDDAEDWWDEGIGDGAVVGATTVPGGCVLVQTWGYQLSTHDVVERLSVGTVAYGMYANPKSGNQGSAHRDGAGVGSDLHPGGGVSDEATAEDVLRAHLYNGEPVAFCLACSGLRPADDRAFVTPDLWLRLPEGDR
jgi:hypothetical protein